MTTPPQCSLDTFPRILNKKQKYTPEELTELEKEASLIVQRMEAQSKNMADVVSAKTADAAKYQAYQDLVFHKNLGELEQLKPGNIDKVGELMASLFGQKHANLGTHPGQFSKPGAVWYDLQQMRRIAGGMIDAKARWEGTFAVKDMMQSLKGIMGDKPIPFKDMNELVQRLIEVGQIPQQRATFLHGAAGDVFNQARYQDLVDQLKAVNLTDDQINQMISKASSFSQIMDEVRAMAKGFGVDTGKNVEGIGYFSRIMTGDAKRFFSQAQEATTLYEQMVKPPSPVNTLTALIKDRETFHYIPESEALMSYVLGVQPDKLREMLADGKEFVKYLHTNVSPQDLDMLVEKGLMSKIPMTTPEVFNYLRSQYKDMPFKQMDEMFKTNPFDVLDFYTHELEREAGRSAQVQNFFKEGIKSGWIANPADVKINKDLYKDFVTLNTDEIKQIIPNFEGGLGDKVYVHGTAWNMFKSQLEIARDPAALNSIATTFKYMGNAIAQASKTINQALLINPVYPIRILTTDIMAAAAAGANLLRMPEGMMDFMRLNQKGLEVLDDAKKVYEIAPGVMVSKRELFRDVYAINRSHDIMPQTVTQKTGRIKFDALNPANAPRALSYLKNYAETYGAGKGAEYFGSMLKNLQSEVYSPIGALAIYFESAIKWATLLSVTDRSAGNRIGQFMTTIQSPHHASAADALKYIDEYFPAMDDVGSVTKAMTEYVRPFAQFAMANPLMQIRHAMRNPNAYMNYWRVRSLLNSGAAQDPDMINGALPDYVLDGGGVALHKLDGKWVMFMTQGSDPVFDGATFLERGSQNLEHYTMGAYTGSSENQRKQLGEEYAGHSLAQQFFVDMFKDTNPLYQEAIAQYTGKDAKTGRPIDQTPGNVERSFLGVNMPNQVKHLLSLYAPLRAVDTANPFEVFGTPEIRDPKTNQIVQPGRPSFAGVQRQPDSQFEQYIPGDNHNWIISLARATGYAPKLIDYARGTQYTYSDINHMAQQANGIIQKATMNIRFRTDISPDQRNKLLNELNTTIEQYGQLEIDKARIAAYMQQHGIPPKENFDKINQAINKQLQPLGQDAMKEIVAKIKVMKQKAGITDGNGE